MDNSEKKYIFPEPAKPPKENYIGDVVIDTVKGTVEIRNLPTKEDFNARS